MRFQWILFIAAAAANPVLGTETGLAQSAEPIPAQSAPEPIYWIQLERGDSIEARAAEVSGDFLRYTRADGSTGYIPANRVEHIYDPVGSDRVRSVLNGRKRLGGPPEANDGPCRDSFRFRGADKSRCDSYLLTEAAVLFPLKADAGFKDDQKMYGSLDLGWMTNVSRSSALGASGFWESGSDHNRGGLRLRYRRWLDHFYSVEFSPGVVVQGNDTYDAPGFIGQAAFNAGDFMSVVVEGEVDRYSYAQYVWNGSGYVLSPTQHRSDTTWRVGLRGGSYVGLGAAFLAGLAIGAIAATWSSGSFL